MVVVLGTRTKHAESVGLVNLCLSLYSCECQNHVEAYKSDSQVL